MHQPVVTITSTNVTLYEERPPSNLKAMVPINSNTQKRLRPDSAKEEARDVPPKKRVVVHTMPILQWGILWTTA
ncbi:hypothetical protein QJS04_geneDACA019895 [Acorus gramineus]|uniref:Uncharacterized protein n=1 Tax=Acorus gramineus TaxID=55184 RepID=A0AAV8ZXA3_ACOGR|nr:hypothetical protein QJS04_geneDACA019895 [Acorus gramineus]